MLTLTAASALAVLLLPDPRLLVRGRRRPSLDHEHLLTAVAAELRAGATLRQALAAATAGTPEMAAVARLARAGAPLAMVAAALGADSRLSAAIAVANRSGGRSAMVFARLAERANADADLLRQRRVLTAQARLSALIVAGLPVVWLMFGGVGRIVSLIDAGAGVVAGLGITMEVAGMALVWRLTSR